VAFAIEDHYKPRFAGDALPRTPTGVVVALADKLETLVGLFGIGNLPTGDKDPFALRRHALGVIRMLIERNLPLEAALAIVPQANARFEAGDFTASLQILAGFRAPVDAFFDDVMVNAEALDLRLNRQGLLRLVHDAMNRVADLSRLAS
jgi:glycyl-tRNA synthetase beta subunit